MVKNDTIPKLTNLEGTDPEIILAETKRIQDLMERMSEEVIVFDGYLNRVTQPSSLKFKQEANRAIDTLSEASHTTGMSSHSQSTTATADKQPIAKKRNRKLKNLLKLDINQKLIVSQSQIDELNREIDRERNEYLKKMDNYQAQLQEAEIEIDAVEKEQKEFTRVIMKGGLNPRTDKIIAEKLINHLENGIKQRVILIDKYRLKCTSLQVHIKKAYQQLEHREEMGEVLSKIDFDQLKIENDQMREKIKERNNELVQLKLQTGKTVQTLTALMDKLNRLTQSANQLRKQIDIREKHVNQLKKEIIMVEKEKIQQKRKHEFLVQHHDQVRVPSILDYVKIKSELDVIRKEVDNWERKREISEVNVKMFRSKLNKAKKASHAF
mmetsp:Transcript_4020/g.5935  ORF Transcript_4020/g.5935 Transcript_4020/m.5935 type:complete len:382 (-) Transcript_4020:1711-2856(-)|eukprot:CAMPEP_0117426074 /NCGR_PEP_ID=MMETSP0758-20121206/6244_1 /TAXON_ID=63605 /ORGANISM="Percolomonas cosmopolitus, Strain AE-1 (ATCC 50343)" /LENGTH=381 /DNA_ID=CAMNT_0005210991 /DNA_START=87 /DNA_END=1232 /DNA_ORIENTATION=-